MNDVETVKRWMTFLLARDEYPARALLSAAFGNGHIKRICDCGCNSFDFAVSDDRHVLPISHIGSGGAVFQICFKDLRTQGEIELRVCADPQGHFAGLDVEFQGNGQPVPLELELAEPPTYVHASNTLFRD